MKLTNPVMFVAILTGLLAVWIGSSSRIIAQTALDTYVAAFDPSYSFTPVCYGLYAPTPFRRASAI